MVKSKVSGKKNNSKVKLGLLTFFVLAISVFASVFVNKDSQSVQSLAGTKCKGTWKCKLGSSAIKYQCNRFNNTDEATCTGGGVNQGNYCPDNYLRKDGCSWANGPTTVPSKQPPTITPPKPTKRPPTPTLPRPTKKPPTPTLPRP